MVSQIWNFYKNISINYSLTYLQIIQLHLPTDKSSGGGETISCSYPHLTDNLTPKVRSSYYSEYKHHKHES